MISRVIQIIIVLMLTASCAQNNKNYKANQASNLDDESLKAFLSYPKKHLQHNLQLCKALPIKYAKAEQQLKQIKDNDSYKFRAGIITGIYRYTALRTNCSTDFLNKNPSMFNLDGKPRTSEYNDPGVFYFMQGELIGFLTEGVRLTDKESTDYSSTFVVVFHDQLYVNTKIGGDINKSIKLMQLGTELEENQFFKDYNLPLK